MDTLLPPDPDLELLHVRDYQVRSFRRDDGGLLLRGAVRDTKPAGLYIPGDPDPLVIHHMVVDLWVDLPTLVISDVRVQFERHPHTTCPRIVEHYRSLVGLSIARGFTHKVRELFGGPRGCTHTTALLQAMAPVAVQSMWSMQMVRAREAGAAAGEHERGLDHQRLAELRRGAMASNLNTCHVWQEDGEMIATLREGGDTEMPIFITERMTALGRNPDDWRRQMTGGV